MKCEKCIHYGVCIVNSYCHERCGYYEETRPHGEWILLKQGGVFCKNCKFTIPFRGSKPKYSFCPNCGADMREGEAE